MELLNEKQENSRIIGSHKSTLLHKAVHYKREWCVKTLLDNGCSLQQRNSKNYTCLELSIIEDSIDVLRELLQHGVFESSEMPKLRNLANRLNRFEILNILTAESEGKGKISNEMITKEQVRSEVSLEDGEIVETDDIESQTKHSLVGINLAFL